jgi:zinc protease
MLLFGRNHPYGRPAQGLPSTVQRIQREDLVDFHRRYWSPATSALIFTGDISLAEAVALTEQNFGTWTATQNTPPIAIPPPEPPATGGLFVVDRQDAPQTVVVQLLPGPVRTAPDYYALRLVDAIWGGGGFRTRLNLNLREDKGYAYGVFSNLVTLSKAGAWWASGSVQTDKTAESVAEFERELAGLAGKRPLTEEELAEARDARIRGYSQQFESIGRIFRCRSCSGRSTKPRARRCPISKGRRGVTPIQPGPRFYWSATSPRSSSTSRARSCSMSKEIASPIHEC